MRGSPVNRLERPWAGPGATDAQLQESAFWKSKAQQFEREAESFIEEHPRVALAAAAVLGLMLGWMVKRR